MGLILRDNPLCVCGKEKVLDYLGDPIQVFSNTYVALILATWTCQVV